MLNNENYKELLDLQLKGKLSPQELAELELSIKSNPALQNEAALQAAIVSGIQASRKAELKARLNSIEVGGSATTQWWRYAAAVGIIATVSFWYYVSRQPAQPQQQLSSVPAIVLEKNEPSETASSAQVPTISQQENVVPVQPALETASKISSSAEPKPSITKQEAAREKELSPALPEVHSPEMNVHDHLDKEFETPKHELTKTPQLGATVAGVEVVKSKKHSFHYQYFDNKLFLYGNFDSNTYEILELNTSKGQKLYLRFEENYYGLEPDKTEISKLEQVKNKQTIKELDEIQKK